MLLGSVAGMVVFTVHVGGSGGLPAGTLAESSGAFFFVWTLLALAVSSAFSAILSVLGLWSLRRSKAIFARPPSRHCHEAPVTADDRNWAMAAHLARSLPSSVFRSVTSSGRSSSTGAWPGPRRQHAKASLNYQLTVSIAAILSIVAAVSIVLALIIVGILARVDQYGHVDDSVGIISVWAAILAIVLGFAVASIVFIIKGSIAVSEGRPYTYPFSFRFFRF